MRTIAKPALHTLWQAFAAALVIWWGVAGAAGWHKVTDVPSAEKFAVSALLAALAALLSAALHTVRQYGPAFLRAEAKDNPDWFAEAEAEFEHPAVPHRT